MVDFKNLSAQGIMTPTELWQNFSVDEKNFKPVYGEEEILLTDAEGRILAAEAVTVESVKNAVKLSVCPVTFNGRNCGEECVRIGAFCVRPDTDEVLPVLVAFPEENMPKERCLTLGAFFASLGYAVLVTDVYGVQGGRFPATRYPSAVAYAALNEAQTEELEMRIIPVRKKAESRKKKRSAFDSDLFAEENTVSLKDSALYEWTAVGFYAVAFARLLAKNNVVGVYGVGMGGDVAWRMLAHSSVACGIVRSSAGWRSDDADESVQGFWLGMDAQNYAPLAEVPVMMIQSLRDTACPVEKARITYERILERDDNLFVCTEEAEPFADAKVAKSCELFLTKCLKKRNLQITSDMAISLTEKDGRKFFQIDSVYKAVQKDYKAVQQDEIFKDYEVFEADKRITSQNLRFSDLTIGNAEIYVGDATLSPEKRVWHKLAKAAKEQMLFLPEPIPYAKAAMLARVETASGIMQCSNVEYFDLSENGIAVCGTDSERIFTCAADGLYLKPITVGFGKSEVAVDKRDGADCFIVKGKCRTDKPAEQSGAERKTLRLSVFNTEECIVSAVAGGREYACVLPAMRLPSKADRLEGEYIWNENRKYFSTGAGKRYLLQAEDFMPKDGFAKENVTKLLRSVSLFASDFADAAGNALPSFAEVTSLSFASKGEAVLAELYWNGTETDENEKNG